MAKPPPLPALDDRLARLGREWFAQVRAENPPERYAPRTRDDTVADTAAGGIVDWLFGDSDGGDGDGGDTGSD